MAAIKYIRPVLFSIFIVLGSITTIHAKTSLVSLPQRQHVAVRFGDTSTTLVQEKRILFLKKGMNQIDFSWKNVMIDPESITLTTLSDPDKITILSVSYPPDENTLVWNINSITDLEEEVMISYLLANIDSIITYKVMTDDLEKTIDLKTYLVLRNFSGENYDRVTTHLNENKPFITSISHLETKQVLISQKLKIPIKKIYTWDALKMPHDPGKFISAVGIPTSYEFKYGLLKGKARLFQKDNKDSAIFLGEDMTNYTPAGDKTKLQIGDSLDIVVAQQRLSTTKTGIKQNTKGQEQMYNEIIKDRVIIENLKDRPVTLSIIETIQGQWEPLDISMEYELKDHKTLIFNVELLPKEKKSLDMHYTIFNIFAQKFSQYNQVMQ